MPAEPARAEATELLLTRAGFCRQRAWFADRSSFSRWIVFPAMIAVIRHPRLGTILFDTGYGRALQEARSLGARAYRRMLPFELSAQERLPARLEQLGVGRVDCIFLSHFHPDHIGGLREVPGPPILHSRAGLERLRSLRRLRKWRSAFFAELLPADFESRTRAIEDLPVVPSLDPLPNGFDVAGDGSLIAVPLPGHAAGQFGLLCHLPQGRIVFLCADAAWLKANIVKQASPAWPVRLLVDDPIAFSATLELLRRFATRNPSVAIVPSHCEQSIADYERQV